MVQVFGLSHLTLFTVSPDALSILLAFISVTIGQRTGTTFGFAAGVLTGLFSGNMGLSMLARTVEGFIAGYFHIPENSHATSKQKTKRLYGAAIAASFAANAVYAAGYNPLGLSPIYRIVVLGLLESLITLILAFIVNWLLLRKTLSD
jgi:rod shape-determining protein MreD